MATRTLPLPFFAPIALGEVLPLTDGLPDAFRCLLLDAALLRAPDGSTATAPRDLARRALAQGGGPVWLIFAFEATTSFTIGRKATNAIVLADRRVSGVHAAIAPGVAPRCQLSDLGSSNGTFFAERCLAPGAHGFVALAPGDHFTLADVRLTLLDREGLRALR